ncbi:MAG: hypothetical protein K9K35_09985 [Rhodoferax sp.]|nr:hypothetical protein [Rhodoferax sp.]
MIESLLGGLLGGLFRLAPELLKWLDKKEDRKHELAMLEREMEFAKVRAEQAMHMVDAQTQTAQFDAVGEALKGQTEMSTAAGKFVSGVSALVRPLVTYWVVCLWSGVKIASMTLVYQTGGSWQEMLQKNWGPDDNAVLSMILIFWFLGRTIEPKK